MTLPYAVASAAFSFLVLLSILANHFLPAGPKLPMHWNAKGQAGMFAQRWVALSFMPILAGASFLLIAFISAGTAQGGRTLLLIAPLFVATHCFYLFLMQKTPPGPK
jgi:hypothetical protein